MMVTLIQYSNFNYFMIIIKTSLNLELSTYCFLIFLKVYPPNYIFLYYLVTLIVWLIPIQHFHKVYFIPHPKIYNIKEGFINWFFLFFSLQSGASTLFLYLIFDCKILKRIAIFWYTSPLPSGHPNCSTNLIQFQFFHHSFYFKCILFRSCSLLQLFDKLSRNEQQQQQLQIAFFSFVLNFVYRRATIHWDAM